MEPKMKTVGTFTLPKRYENEKEITVSFRLLSVRYLGVRIHQKNHPIELRGGAEADEKVTEEILRAAVTDAYNYEGHPEKVPQIYLGARNAIEALLVYYAIEDLREAIDPLEIPGPVGHIRLPHRRAG